MRKLLLIASAAALIGGAASAETRAVKIETAKVDFNDQAQVKRLYARLNAAAMRVCETSIDEQYSIRPDQACVDKAVADAVGKISQPRLTAMLPAPRNVLTATDDR